MTAAPRIVVAMLLACLGSPALAADAFTLADQSGIIDRPIRDAAEAHLTVGPHVPGVQFSAPAADGSE